MGQANQLKNIYLDLSQGKLTQQQALEKIKAIKLEKNNSAGVLLATPIWESDLPVVLSAPDYEVMETVQHYILLCNVPNFDTTRLASRLASNQVFSLIKKNENLALDYSGLALTCFERIQTILKSSPEGKVMVQVVAINNEQAMIQSGLSGLLKSAMLENPQLITQIVFTDIVDFHQSLNMTEKLAQQLQDARSCPQETVINYQQGVRNVLRWREIGEAVQANEIIAFKNDGTYLITGGLGGLGVLLTREILQQTSNAKIILTGRSALTPEKQSILDDFSKLNVYAKSRIEYHQVDIENLEQVELLITSIKAQYQSLNGIIHCAGKTADNFIIKKSSEEFSQVLGPKVLGTYYLDQAGRDLDLDFFALFSSAASWLGNIGQSDYATANGFLDQFSAYRNQLVSKGERKGKSISINWPLWQEGGMRIEQASLDAIEESTGAVQLQTSTGMRAFYRSLQLPYSQLSVTEGDVRKMRVALLENAAHRQAPSKDRAVATSATNISENKVATVSQSKDSLQNFQERTQNYLCKQFSKLLKLPSYKIDAQAPMEKYGIDSIMAMDLTTQLEKIFGSLPKTLFFEYHTISELTQYFVRSHLTKIESLFATTHTDINTDKNNDKWNVFNSNEVAFDSTDKGSTSIKNKSSLKRRRNHQRITSELTPAYSSNGSESVKSEPIAIVGIAGRYPGAVNLEAYWENLSSGKDCIISIPEERWEWQKFYSEDPSVLGSHVSKWGGFIEGVDEFDPRFFNISPREAETIDPQERLFLQHAWMAVEDAGFTRATLQIPHENAQAGQVGVYVGVMYGEYSLSGSLASIANRVSYVLNLHGPSMTLDTMCSSSLTAIHLACQDLKHGRTDLGIAGGVNVTIHPNKYEMLSTEQFISSGGHCQSFGEGGDGYIPGEGVGAVILKRLSEAVQDDHHIYGVIKGSALNHGGKTNGYTVPNPQAQTRVISQALFEAEIDPYQVSYIEAHGTGTKLGDPIEIAALTKAFNQQGSKIGANGELEYCLIGSVKSNIGHCESAAGVAGLTKVLLQMKHRQVVPSLHSTKLNPHIDFNNTPFVVNQKLTEWKVSSVNGIELPRIAGVSSFGAGGSNAHIIIEEFRTSKSRENISFANQNEKSIIPLSARTAEQLKQKAIDLLNFITDQRLERSSQYDNESPDYLSAMAYTLQVGREAMDERVGFIVSSIDQLLEKLNAFISEQFDVEDIYLGQVKNNRETISLLNADSEFQETIDKWVARKKLSRLLDWWVKGFEFDWNVFYSTTGDLSASTGKIVPRRISLPTYPFAKERYWNDPVAKTSKLSSSVQMLVRAIHPLLHSNHSNLRQQSYSSIFTGQEFFLDDSSFSQKNQSVEASILQPLPIAVYLEMAMAAVEHAMPTLQESVTIELQDIVLGQPAMVGDNRRVAIDLFSTDETNNTNEQIEFEIHSHVFDLENKSNEISLSQTNDDGIIHCQGRAIFNSSPKPQSCDFTKIRQAMQLDTSFSFRLVGALYRGKNQLLAELNLSDDMGNSLKDFILHPSLMNSVMRMATDLVNHEDQLYSPVDLKSVRVIFRCTHKMIAWLRYTDENISKRGAGNCVTLDVDLCDLDGNICVQLQGVKFESAALSLTPPSLIKASIPTSSMVEKIELTPVKMGSRYSQKKSVSQFPISRVNSEKPEGVTLVEVDSADRNDFYYKTKKRPSINLPSFQSHEFDSHNIEQHDSNIQVSIQEKVELTNSVSLFNLTNGVYSIQIGVADSENLLEIDVVEQVTEAFKIITQAEDAKALLLIGTENNFLQGSRTHINDALKSQFYQAIISFPYPTIAVMQGDASGAGFLTATLCDFMVISEDAHYQYGDTQSGLYPSINEIDLLSKRFGESIANGLLDSPARLTGEQLRARGWTAPILPSNKVSSYAQKLALDLANKSQNSLRLLKQHLSRHLVNLVSKLIIVEPTVYVEDDVKDKNKEKAKSVKALNSLFDTIHLRNEGVNILVISVKVADTYPKLNSLVDNFSVIFNQINQMTTYKIIVLESDYPDFFPQSKFDNVDEIITNFRQLILSSEIPVIAALNSNAKGASWLMSLYCDACIYCDQGRYTIEHAQSKSDWLKQAAAIITYRFGNYLGKEILLTGDKYSGIDLKQKRASVRIAKQGQVVAEALQLAHVWSQYPRTILVERKSLTSQRIQKKLDLLPSWLEGQEKKLSSLHKSPKTLSLNTNVISAEVYPQGILRVTMEDRQAKNMFSHALAEGITEIFTHIEQTSSYKVIILTGYENYFATGGTKETLIAIQEGKVKFTDSKIYQAALKCSLPVIAAMQGHAVGAGWVLGMFADFTIFSEESQYMSPYMNYGFTPGAGSTLVFPERLGYDLARETLLTAQEVAGNVLKNRGVPFPVLPRKNVLSAAMALAEKIAKHSRSHLIALKHQMTSSLQSLLDETYKLELSMHEKTFVGQSETLTKIQNKFSSKVNINSESEMSVTLSHSIAENQTQVSEITIEKLTVSLKKLLADELRLQTSEIEEDTQFVELGLDSITGVVWIKKVNAKYGTAIEAAKVYSYPTLKQLCRFIKQEIDGNINTTHQAPIINSTDIGASLNKSVSENSEKNIVPAKNSKCKEENIVTSLLPAIIKTLKNLLAEELRLQVAEIDEDAQFVELGLDSITGVTWIRKINEQYKTSIEATKVYSYPTLKQLSGYVQKQAQVEGILTDKMVNKNSAHLSNTQRSLVAEKEAQSSHPLNSSVNLFTLNSSEFGRSVVKQLVSRRRKKLTKVQNDKLTFINSQPIAVIGMAGQFPQAKNLDTFWENIAQSKNCIKKIPENRWDIEAYYQPGEAIPGKTNSQWMGALEEFDLFDPLFFNISPKEAKSMDPQQRVFLQTCWSGIENAGYSAQSLSGKKCGVFVGCAAGDYHLLSRQQQISAQGFTGEATSILAARVSYFLNLQGPCLSIDTACSSSLVAIANACDSLSSGGSDLALAGGVYVMSGPEMLIKTSQTGMLSPDGRCFTFDQRANGFVPGEGVGVVMLKRLKDAEKDQDIIQGVIQGWGVNQDGKTNGITAPNPEAQRQLLQDVYEKYKIDPAGIQLIEAHGTGTKLGDPIEIDGLKESFKKFTRKTGYCALGSVKSNIGHCLTAAGVSGVIKIILALKHKQLPPTINFEHLNEHIGSKSKGLKNTPFFVNTRLKDWEIADHEQRQAAISSFGFSGTNAHMVIAEYKSDAGVNSNVSVIRQNGKLIIPLSARTSKQLRQKARDLLKFLRIKTQSIELVELAYTLQVGRDAMEERLGFMVDSVAQLVEKLEAFVSDANSDEDTVANIDDVYRGQVEHNKEGMRIISQDDEMKETVIEKWLSGRNLSKLLDLWVKGLELDWSKLYYSEDSNKTLPNRISLPTYPFAKERYWIEPVTQLVSQSEKTFSGTNNPGTNIAGVKDILHSLLHANTSDLSQQRYTSCFSGNEFFLKKLPNEQKFLPAMTSLEMVRVAIENAIPDNPDNRQLELHDVVWAQSVVVDGNNQISIALFATDSGQVDYEIYSQKGAEEIIHSQGHACFVQQEIIQQIDIAAIQMNMIVVDSREKNQTVQKFYQNESQRLVEIQLPKMVEETQACFNLHPNLIDAVLLSAVDLIGSEIQAWLPFALESIRFASACNKKMFAWLRFSSENYSRDSQLKLDVDICDESGNVCIKIRGLRYQQIISQDSPQVEHQKNETEENVVPKHISIPIPLARVNEVVSKKIELKNLQKTISQIDIDKPSSVSLTSTDDQDSDILCFSQNSNVNEKKLEKSSGRSVAKLSNVVFAGAEFKRNSGLNRLTEEPVNLFEHGNGVYSIQIINDADNNQLTGNLVQQLLLALEAVKRSNTVKVLMIKGSETNFLHGQRDDYRHAVTEKLYQKIINFPFPIIAIMQGDASGAGFLIGALCDFMICNKTGNYHYIDAESDFYPSVNEVNLFNERFGSIIAYDFLYCQTKLTGKELQERGWTCAVIESDHIETYAQKIATRLTTKSQSALRLLKQHLSRHLIKSVSTLEIIGTDISNESNLLIEERQQKARKENGKIKSNSNWIKLDLHLGKTAVIRMTTGKKNSLKKKQQLDSLVSDLENVFEQIKKSECYRTIVLTGDQVNFLSSPVVTSDSKILERLQQIILDSSIPVVAAVNGDVSGNFWMISQFCDACIYNLQGRYSVKDIRQSSRQLSRAAMIFEYRFGSYLGKEIVLTAKEYSGYDLQQRLASLKCVEQSKVLSTAMQLAEDWAEQPLSKLFSWKKQSSTSLIKKLKGLPEWSEQKGNEPVVQNERTKNVVLNSKVISATAYPTGILLVRMEDRDAKNMFSDAFIEGMFEVFEHIESTPDYKVIVLTGYDSYFSSGGTKEGLLAIQDGQYKFTDRKVFQLAMTCRLPVIAAMQGHGIGAGWSMGMYADLTLMSEESHFVSPYMNYGFTPGAGSTAIFPQKIGYDLARDTMLTAQEYSGNELKKKGLSITILPRKNVVSEAMSLAQQIARHSRHQSMSLKQQWNQPFYELLEETFQLELAMHEKTFVGQSEAFEQIQNRFSNNSRTKFSDNQRAESLQKDIRHKELQSGANLTSENNELVKEAVIESLSSITYSLKKLLAQELQMSEQDIYNNTPFTNLGVDSIISVSWVKKINERYKTSLEGTKTYSYPTLSELSQYVKDEVDKLGHKAQSSIEAHENYHNRPLLESRTTKSEMLQTIVASLKNLLAQELQMSEQDIGKDTLFINLGVDSIVGVSWVRKVNVKYQISIEGSKIYSYPTLSEFSQYVQEVLEREENLLNSEFINVVQTDDSHITTEYTNSAKQSVTAAHGNAQFLGKDALISPKKKLKSWRNSSVSKINNSHVSSKVTTSQSQPIAVIGMAGQFPQANNLQEFWQNIASGKNCISEIPKNRWDIDSYYQPGNIVPGKTDCKWMGALEGYDLFDPLFFNISPLEAENMDPQQRLFLQTCWHTIEDAGYNAEMLSGSKCGVFVGCGTGDYHQFSQEMGSSTSILAARISYFLNLQGPCLSIDTACSSSLVAMANACDSLNSAGSDIILAGGVCVLSGPSMHIGASQSGMLSTNGRCFTFDQKANGFVPGEGVGVVMLKRLSDAERDNDIIHGVIQGWGVNQDGKTNGITAPNPKSQTRLQQEIYDKFNIDPAHIQLVEAHGTGTQLGDPIEVEGLQDSFRKYTQKRGYCALGSVKSNIGHCLFAAGISGFIKVILSLKHQQLPPTINFERLNEHIERRDISENNRGLKARYLKESPFYINDQLQQWELNNSPKRQAAVSSFGFSGTNAHLVVAEYQPSVQSASPLSNKAYGSNVMIPLSAKTQEQLKQKAIDLLDFILQKQHRNNPEQAKIILNGVAYTLQVGRQPMEERLGFIACSIEQLVDRLQAYIRGTQNPDNFYQGKVNLYEESVNIINRDDDMKDVIDKWMVRKKYSKLLDLWVKGLELDWNKLYSDLRPGEFKPKRISLPTYPFAKERYWLDSPTVSSYLDSRQTINRTSSGVGLSDEAKINKNFESIEDIINRIADDSIETKQGVTLLKKIV